MGFKGANKMGLVVGFLSVAIVAFAITIIVLINNELWPAAGFYTVCNNITGVCGSVYWDGICLMDNASVNICAYGYAAAVIGIVAALITVFSACLPALAAVLVNAFSFLWWLGFAITVTVYNNDVANDTSVLFPDGYPRGYYRNIVIALSWTACACAALSVPLALKGGKAEAAEDGKQGSHKGEQFVADPPPPAAVV